MANCTFLGHRDCPETIKPRLREILVDMITNHEVNMFYVGHQGQFDAYVHGELKKLKQEYPQINYAVVLAYMPGKKTEYDDYAVTYITHSWGGAYRCAEKAMRQKKFEINL